MLTVVFLGRKFIGYSFINSSVIKYVISAGIMTVTLLLLHCYCNINVYAKLVVEVIVGVAVYAALLLILKDSLFIGLVKPVINKILRKA